MPVDLPSDEEIADDLAKLTRDWAKAPAHERAACIGMVGTYNAGAMRELADGIRKWAEFGLVVARSLEQLGRYAEAACALAATTIDVDGPTPHTDLHVNITTDDLNNATERPPG